MVQSSCEGMARPNKTAWQMRRADHLKLQSWTIMSNGQTIGRLRHRNTERGSFWNLMVYTADGRDPIKRYKSLDLALTAAREIGSLHGADTNADHLACVCSAVAAGLPVPAAVLADYPVAA
jgi:hypothetical protein